MAVAFVFPGQGSQAVGMGREIADEFPAARAVFDEVDDALGEPLSKLIWDGPVHDLTLTRNAQPALMAVSLAVTRAMETLGVTVAGNAAFVAGHSLGEYSALAAAGTLTIGDAARLLRIRGEAMQDAVPVGQGAMAAILGPNIETVREIAAKAAQGDVCQAANDNAPGQVVVSGTKAAVERAIDIAKARGAKRAMLLPVSAPFHSALMEPAASIMADALSGVDMAAPVVPIIANVTAQPEDDVRLIRRNLIAQVTGAVRWRESMEWLADNGVDRLVEVGAGKVLTGLARRISPDLSAMPTGTPDDLRKVVDSLQT